MVIARPQARVVVTGGAGFIGSHLVDRLAAAGCAVTVLDNFRNGRRENLAEALRTGRVRVQEGDIRDPSACAEALRGAEAVFHLACLGVRHSLHDPAENHEVNATGTLRLLDAARAARVGRFLYVSSSEVYGAARVFPLTEEAATWPTTVYGASKLAGEHYAAAYQICHGLPVVRVRPFNNYGPRAHFEGDSGEVIPRFILRALAGQRPVVFGDGSHTRDFLFVRDCAEALVAIAEADALVGDLVNLGYGEEIRIDALATLVTAAAGRSDLPASHEPERPGDVPRLWVDAGKLRRTTGFRPRTAPAEGLAETAAYYRALYAADPEVLGRIQTRNWEKP
ncbi:MAG TPA: SDR family NAD(P)-dependent oxidoreductase [Opitutaceae bacterium]|nr:SDR family NAD(P)-dependent oxidoreductase [Opitutaceae bacterium]